MATNTAIDFCRSLQAEYKENFPKQEGLHEKGCIYCLEQFLPDTNAPASAQTLSDEPCLVMAAKISSIFLRDTKDDGPNIVPNVNPNFFELYAPADGQTPAETEQKGLEDFKLAMSVLPEYYALILQTPRLQAEQEIVRGLRQLLSSKKQVFWLTFGIQVLLDIRHILRRDVVRGFDDLCRETRAMISSINRTIDFHRQVGMRKFSRSSDNTLSETLGLLGRWVNSDHVSDIIDRQNRLVNPDTTTMPERHHLLRRDPLWCGLLLYNFRMVAHEGAIIAANKWGMILATTHLYNCLRQNDLLSREWNRMERVLFMHKAEKLLVGDRPNTLEECTKHFALAVGVPVSQLARNRRKNRREVYKRAKPRSLDKLAPVSWTFKARFCDGDLRTDLGPGEVREILRKTALKEEARMHDRSGTSDMGEVPLDLAWAIHKESWELKFDHFEMHIHCWKFLRRLHETIGEGLGKWHENFRDDRDLPLIVLELLMRATGAKKVKHALGNVAESLPLAAELMEAGKILEQVIRDEE